MIDLETLGDWKIGREFLRWITPNGILRKWTALATVLLGSVAAEAKIIYVNAAIPTSGDGSSWAKSYQFLRDGLDASSPDDQIYLAKGTYFPDDGVSGDFGNRELSFKIDGVQLYGGFVGTETSVTERNPVLNPTILSGEIFAGTGQEVNWSLHVIVVQGNSTLDGVTIQKGNANGSVEWNRPRIVANDQGGGCYVKPEATLTLQGCTMFDNRAIESGGAIMVENATGKVIAANCKFDLNQVNSYRLTTSSCSGGAIAGNVTASKCIFSANKVSAAPIDLQTTAQAAGGAIAGKAVLTQCDFSGNSVTSSVVSSGGAVFGVVDAVNCTFSANKGTSGIINADGTGEGGGGALFVIDGVSTLANCVFIKNTSGVRGGAIHSGTTLVTSTLTIANSTFLDNGVTTGFKGAALSCGGFVRIYNNIFWNTAASATTFDQNNLIHVVNKGLLRNTDLLYPSPAGLAENVVKRGVLGITDEPGADLYLGVAATTLRSGDPLFVNATTNPLGADNKWRTADDALRIRVGSSAIGTPRDPSITYRKFVPPDILDIDDNGDKVEPIASDAAGFVRVQGNFVDMGAYEFGDLLYTPIILVEQPAGTVLMNGATIDFSTSPRVATTFVIKNNGTASLNKLVLTMTGAHMDSFEVTQPLATSVVGGGTTTFMVKFVPLVTGLQTATLHIASNDPSKNPYDITLQGNVPVPLISVQFPVGSELTDEHSEVNFGGVGSLTSSSRTITIRNSGNGDLNILGITSSGTDAKNFTPSAPSQAVLAPGATTTFNVVFRPSGTGVRSGSIIIDSTDLGSGSSFLINVTGSGFNAPEIVVSEPFASEISDGDNIKFGSVGLGLLHSKTFVVKNAGLSTLKKIGVALSDSGAFTITKLKVTSLNVGSQSKFTVIFKPTGTGKKTAKLEITSNDIDESRIVINLSGNGASSSASSKQSGFSAVSASFAASPFSASRNSGVVTVTQDSEGLKYLVLTVEKPLFGDAVEVSSNLTEWSSGKKFTTTLADNASVLRVRDNTPVRQGKKRYIRLK